jgi:GT2 family glycosyltransferase
MKIAVIVLSWNSRDMIERCLSGLSAHERYEIYVVDNGSVDGSPEMIAEKYPSVRLIRSPGNLGFAEGNNVGIRQALADGHDAVFLLNNDTIIDEPFVQPCVEVLERDPRVGIVGPVVVEGDDPDVVQCRGGKAVLWNLYFPFLHRGKRYVKNDSYEIVDWVLGAAMLIRKEVFEKAGGLLDPEFFPAYLEEAEFCYRAGKAGYVSAICDRARVRHIGRQSSGGYRNAFRRMMVNRFLFAVKHLDLGRFITASIAIVGRVMIEKVRGACRWTTAS